MNSSSNFDDKRQQDEWEAQERAAREERTDIGATSEDARVMQYRLIARTLRHPPIDPLPSDFALSTAERIESLANTADERFEIWLQRSLIVLLSIASVVAALYFGNIWWRAFALSIHQIAELGLTAIARWGAIVAACLGFSWAIERWSRQFEGR